MPIKSELERMLEATLPVAIDGRAKIQRGELPDLPYGDILDPQEAYETAVVKIHVATEFVSARSYSSLPRVRRVESGIFQVDYSYGHIETSFDLLYQAVAGMQDGVVTISGMVFPCVVSALQVNFNGALMRVSVTSLKRAFVRDYNRARGGRIAQPAGPNYQLDLSDDEVAVEAAHQAKVERARREDQLRRTRELHEYRERNAAGREFELADVLGVTTGVVMTEGGGLFDVLNFMYGGDGRAASNQCRATLIEQHPWLATAEPPKNFTLSELNAWRLGLEAHYGKTILVKPLPAGELPT